MSSLALTNCVSSPGKDDPPGIVLINGTQCPETLRSKIEPEEIIPDGASFVKPETESEAEATNLFLGWMQRITSQNRDLRVRSGQAQDFCDKLAAKNKQQLTPAEKP